MYIHSVECKYNQKSQGCTFWVKRTAKVPGKGGNSAQISHTQTREVSSDILCLYLSIAVLYQFHNLLGSDTSFFEILN